MRTISEQEKEIKYAEKNGWCFTGTTNDGDAIMTGEPAIWGPNARILIKENGDSEDF